MARYRAGEREERILLIEAELARAALEDRGVRCTYESPSERFHGGGDVRGRLYERAGLIPVHRDLDAWLYVSQDPQLTVAIEEIVNTFSPALSFELQLYSVLGSNSDYATCLVRYLVDCYSTNNVRVHVKNTLRNMARWHVLAGFVPCVFVPWAKLRELGPGLAAWPGRTDERGSRHGAVPGDRKTSGLSSSRGKRKHPGPGGKETRGGTLLRTVPFGASPSDALSEAEQERDAHEKALFSVLEVPTHRLADALKALMRYSVPWTRLSVVCKILQDWIERDPEVGRNPARETEFKMAVVALWGVIKTFEHGRCPVIPECRASSCLAFYDTETDLVTAAVDGVLYRRVAACDGCWSRDSLSLSSLAKRAHAAVKSWADLFVRMSRGLADASVRHLYTSSGSESSSLTHLADAVLASREQQRSSGVSAAGNSHERPLLDNLSRFLTADRAGVFGLNADELPDLFLRSGAGTTFSEHKSASVSHSLSRMMSSMISESKNVLLVRRFLDQVTRHPGGAFARFRADCKDQSLLRAAREVTGHLLRRASAADAEEADADPVTELGTDVKLVCNYPCSVTVAHLEETLSMWTNFWRSTLSGFSQFSRRHNTIQYNNRETVRELESGSPSHVFHVALVTLLNTSGVVFADSLTGRKPDASLTVNDVMLTRDSLHPTAYGLLLSNKLGLRPSDVKFENRGDPGHGEWTTARPNVPERTDNKSK